MPNEFLGFGIAAHLPNLGLVSIAGNRNLDEMEIGVVDLVLRRHNYIQGLKRLIDKFDPEFVGLSTMTFQYYTAQNIAKWIKEEYDSNIKVIMGGYHPTLCNEEITLDLNGNENLSNIQKRNASPAVDYIIRGEGEFALNNFIHAYRNHKPLDKVKGLSWKGNDNKFRHNERDDTIDLSKLKLPDRSARLIKKGYHIIGKVGDVVETSRGCTNLCKFCSIAQMYGRCIRYYEIDRVIADIRACEENGAKSVLFIDDNITLDPLRFEKLCQRIIEEDLNHLEFHTQASVAGLIARDSLIPLMGKAGFSVVFFGVENLSKKNLKFFKKSVPHKKTKDMVKNLHNNGMISFGGFILGNPEDTMKDIELNQKYAQLLDIDFPAWQIMTPFPKTEIRKELNDMGLITNLYDYSRYTGLYANVKTKYLSEQQLESEVLKSYYRYYSPKWLINRLSRSYLLKKYFRYFLSIVQRYGKLALDAWIQSYLKPTNSSKKQSEDMIINKFKGIRDTKKETI